MFKSSRECLQRVQDQQQLPALQSAGTLDLYSLQIRATAFEGRSP